MHDGPTDAQLRRRILGAIHILNETTEPWRHTGSWMTRVLGPAIGMSHAERWDVMTMTEREILCDALEERVAIQQEPVTPSTRARRVYFLPDPTRLWRVPVAAVVRQGEALTTVEAVDQPRAKVVGGASKLALLELEMSRVRELRCFDVLPPAVGPHFELGPTQQLPDGEDPSQWAGLPVVVDRRRCRRGVPRPWRSLDPGTPLAGPYRDQTYGGRTRALYKRWLWAQIRAGGRVFEELCSIAPGEHLACTGTAVHGPVVVQAWRWVRTKGLGVCR
ncbi:MAG: hypothetical protein K0V04_12155 [Deltaproteobacteria bacterium]|nr:hypothetical protein [Deltaproteobacteria bacterium]